MWVAKQTKDFPQCYHLLVSVEDATIERRAYRILYEGTPEHGKRIRFAWRWRFGIKRIQISIVCLLCLLILNEINHTVISFTVIITILIGIYQIIHEVIYGLFRDWKLVVKCGYIADSKTACKYSL